nr:PREDICTED: uncharacterized protein LOC103313781 isoform X2 [Tribolium castaneum]|eukprot:XP_008196169.1 PREDICTED: uncharacterized protein LOC103313781 isoform X2 [Tribolium castaneum]
MNFDICALFLLLGICTVVTGTYDSDEEPEKPHIGSGSFDRKSKRFALIRNQVSGLVLDARKGHVVVEHFSTSPSQLWKVEDAGSGTFYIINKATGNALYLDYQNDRKRNYLITIPKYSLNENNKWSAQWYVNSDDTIVTSRKELAITIHSEDFSPGDKVIGFPKHGRHNQLFGFQYK